MADVQDNNMASVCIGFAVTTLIIVGLAVVIGRKNRKPKASGSFQSSLDDLDDDLANDIELVFFVIDGSKETFVSQNAFDIRAEPQFQVELDSRKPYSMAHLPMQPYSFAEATAQQPLLNPANIMVHSSTVPFWPANFVSATIASLSMSTVKNALPYLLVFGLVLIICCLFCWTRSLSIDNEILELYNLILERHLNQTKARLEEAEMQSRDEQSQVWEAWKQLKDQAERHRKEMESLSKSVQDTREELDAVNKDMKHQKAKIASLESELTPLRDIDERYTAARQVIEEQKKDIANLKLELSLTRIQKSEEVADLEQALYCLTKDSDYTFSEEKFWSRGRTQSQPPPNLKRYENENGLDDFASSLNDGGANGEYPSCHGDVSSTSDVSTGTSSARTVTTASTTGSIPSSREGNDGQQSSGAKRSRRRKRGGNCKSD